MAKKSAKKKSGKRVPWLKVLLIGAALALLAFFTLMQTVRMGVFGELPSEEELSNIRHEEATLVLASDGTIIGKLFAEDRTNVHYEDLPKHLIEALVSTEDARFFTHQGVDGRSYIRVFFRTLLGRDRSGGGGSTISQQIIKNLYGRERHGLLTVPVTKMKEALVAQRLERLLTKNDVLVLYFNSVPFGENTFGIESAAQRFFNKPTKRLNVQEAAVLVGMLKANTTYNPRLHPDASKGRRDQVLELMHDRGHLSRAATDSLRALPIALRYTGGDALDLYGYFNQQVDQEAQRILKELGKKKGTTYDLRKDGLRIHTTLDTELQHAAHDAVHEHLATMQPKLDRELRNAGARKAWEKRKAKRGGKRWKNEEKLVREVYDHEGRRLDTLTYRDSLWHYHRLLNGAVLMMEPASGAVRAWVGGNDHRFLPYDLVQARRQVASTIKPVVYAAALERGLHPCTYLDNEKKSYSEFDGWTPDNFDKDTVGGEVAMWYALAKSMNRPTVDLYFRTGTDTLGQVMKALGLPTKDVDKPAMALGATEVSLRELVPAYGAFAMGGKRVTPQLITRITDAQGKELYKARVPKSVQAISENTAADLIAMLRRAVDQGTGAALRSRYGLTGPYAGKTGTSQDYSDAWFVACTPGLVIGTWVGAFEPNVHFNSALGTGGSLALPIAGRTLKQIEASATLRRKYVRDFTFPMEHETDLDCATRRQPSALERLIEDAFGPKRPRDRDTSEADRRNIFDRLFKKKE
ncbi:MAG: transglycosylase domain-containing protein [Flavobacteriales bacterium]|nr:transglycosylase domain-containing protein [Flavobacteriales bacterium]